jgi:hypothetical protein
MDVIFGVVSAKQRRADVARIEQEMGLAHVHGSDDQSDHDVAGKAT